jgi:hypothetical protein
MTTTQSAPTTKVCTGPAHGGPTELPVTDEHWYFHKSGPYTGKPIARCKLCTNWNKLQSRAEKNGTVECKKIRKFVAELVDRCGSSDLAGVASGVAANTIRSVLHEERCTMQLRTAKRLLVALDQRRKEDRRNGSTSERFREARRRQADIEEKIDRTLGY